MKKLFVIIGVAAMATGCKKDGTMTDPSNPSVNDIKVKTVADNDVTTYFYDANGRVVKKEDQSGSKRTWEYSQGLIKRNEYSTNGTLSFTCTYELNTDGKVQKSVLSHIPGYYTLYHYNPDGTISKRMTKVNGDITTEDFYYSNGNCDSIRFSNSSGWGLTRYFSYYTDKENVLNSSHWGEYFNGKESKNLLKNESGIYSNGDVTEQINCFYEFDGKGRVIKLTNKQGNNQKITQYTYY